MLTLTWVSMLAASLACRGGQGSHSGTEAATELSVCVDASRELVPSAVRDARGVDPSGEEIAAWMRACHWIYDICDRGHLILPQDGSETPTGDPVLLVVACADTLCNQNAQDRTALCTTDWREKLDGVELEDRIRVARALHVALLDYHTAHSSVTLAPADRDLMADAATRMWAVYIHRLMSIRVSPPTPAKQLEP
ncbi:MAG: hypothetical protein R6X02_35530 [Enhygromyxa sp.]